MLESSHAWLGASTSSLAADSYQYQLQSMWQKCWNTNQSLVHNLRFRERGPLKSWRPETMAEAILSVLKEGLSLSQAARKYDIPYPTFVLYANRVHNMLGPSADGGSDLRPKGRGRPQRILLGIWPEDHIRGVIRAVVFRDPQHMKDENLNIGYHHRLQSPSVQRNQQLSTAPPPSYLPTSPGYPAPGYHHNKPPICGQDVVHNYSTSGSGSGGGSGPGSISGSNAGNPGGVSPNSAAAAVVAVAQNLRQQMLAAAAHHHNQQQQQQQQHQQQQPQSQQQQQPPHQQQQSLHPSHHLHPQMNHGQHHMNPSMSGNSQILPQGPGFGFLAAAAAAHCANGTNLVLHSPSPDNSSPRSSPLTQPNNNMEMPMQLGFKPLVNDIPTSRSDHLFTDDIEDLVKRPQPSETPGKMKAPTLPYSPNEASDLSMKAEQMFQEEMDNIMNRPPVSEAAKVKVGMSVSGMPYKGSADSDYLNARPESLFQEDIEDLVKSPQQTQPKEPMHRPVDQRTE